MYTFTALLYHVDHRYYRVLFPDFPGLAASATSLDVIRPLAEATLSNQLEEVRAKGQELPEATPMHLALGEDTLAIALLIQVTPHAEQHFDANIDEYREAAA